MIRANHNKTRKQGTSFLIFHMIEYIKRKIENQMKKKEKKTK